MRIGNAAMVICALYIPINSINLSVLIVIYNKIYRLIMLLLIADSSSIVIIMTRDSNRDGNKW